MPAVKLSQIAKNQTDIAALVSGSTPASKATTLATARSINGVSFDGSINITHYTTCSTGASTVAKVASRPGYSLQTGSRATIKFTYNNTAAAPTMDINSSGAKAIKAFGTTASTVQWVAGDVVELIYDGTNYIMLPTMGMVKAIDDAVDTLNTSLNGLDFVEITPGKWGYKIGGADPVIPFNQPKVITTQGALLYFFSNGSAVATNYTTTEDCTMTAVINSGSWGTTIYMNDVKLIEGGTGLTLWLNLVIPKGTKITLSAYNNTNISFYKLV